jgi:hypothetical protein
MTSSQERDPEEAINFPVIIIKLPQHNKRPSANRIGHLQRKTLPEAL